MNQGLQIKIKLLSSVIVLFLLSFVIISSNSNQGSSVDSCIENIGYFLSELLPKVKPEDLPVPNGFHSVLPPDSLLRVNFAHRQLTVRTYKGVLRQLCWAGACRSFAVKAVQQGKYKQLCFPGRGEIWPMEEWQEHDGIRRCRYLEERIEFPSEAQALAMFYDPNDKDKLYTKSGLVVGYFMEGQTLGLQIRQILINGQIPSNLNGSNDSNIYLRRGVEN